MKLNETVSIRLGKTHAVVFGKLVEIDLPNGLAVVLVDGKRHQRMLKRIRAERSARMALAKKMQRDRLRSRETAVPGGFFPKER